jgi:asparagine synthase (glutamine-hydrolysing)
MCGISGIFSPLGGKIDTGAVHAMNRAIRHRGPDSIGTYQDDNVCLGHVRLSIIDVSDCANQPMHSYDNRYVIVFNGEIYNYKDLRGELGEKGFVFSTKSDTEVLLYAFIEWKEGCLSKLNGIFAFCIYDKVENSIFIARDHLGIKPLHYSFINGQLFFSSEIKALLQAEAIKPELDSGKLLEFFLYRELIRDTFFRNIRTLQPGCYLIFNKKISPPRETCWYRIELLPDETLYNKMKEKNFEARLKLVENALLKSVEYQLVSDVPLGTLCSGGLDSSLLTAMACRLNPDVSVYHVDVEDNPEKYWAAKVADFLGIKLNTVALNKSSFLEQYVDCIYHNDFPLTHTNSVGVYYVSKLAHENSCKVLLTGEGADELFGGYDWRYNLKRSYLSYTKYTKIFNRLLSRVTFMCTGIWTRYFDGNFNFKSRANIPDIINFCADSNYRDNFLGLCEQSYSFISDPIERTVCAAILSDLRDYVYGILHRQDRASMQASIESRVPFLDPDLISLAANLPLDDKISGQNSKIILKQIALRHLPQEVVFRSKMGFGVPSDTYIADISTEIFRSGFLEGTLGYNPDEIIRMIKHNPADFCNTFYGLEIWGRLFVLNQDRNQLKDRYLPGR